MPIKREDIMVIHTWNLGDIFPSDREWTAAKGVLTEEITQILQYRGDLTESSNRLLACLEFNSKIAKDFTRLYSYASMHSDEDTRNGKYEGMKQEMLQIATEFRTKSAFIESELVEMTRETINSFIAQEQGLEVYRFYLEDILRRKAHMLSEKEEQILARAAMIAEGPYNVFSIFCNAELPYPEVVLSDGKTVKLDQAGFSLYRQLPERADREKVFQTFWAGMNRFRGTLGAQLYTQVKKDIFYARSRNYASSLHAALDDNNIPVEVYRSLINNVNDNLDSFHRYLKIKKTMLGVDVLKYHDLYAPVVRDIELDYTIDEAWKLVLAAMEPMGSEYLSILKKNRDERWIDVFPAPGKRSGAYSNDAGYDFHPYILLNYNGKYNDVSTLAHELGHSMHTWFSNKHQPYPLADYSIFVAEVASTFNEALLTDYLLKQISDDNTRLSLLMESLDGIRGTVFRQTQFAEYELLIHETAERGQPLTGDVLTEIYGNILRKYYGHDKGICDIESNVEVEWSYIPHFYYNFYVYQYATSFTASTALASKVINGESLSKENMIKFLSAGGSKYPIDVLAEAGVDMTSSEPFDQTMKTMNRIMDEIEKILKNRNFRAGK